jgi:hypothetical protein
MPFAPLLSNHPQLLMWIADDPEMKRILCLKASDALCELCWCPRAQLNVYGGASHAPRTATEQLARNKQILDLAHSGTATWEDIESLASQLSTLLVPCYLSGWADRDSAATDLHL